MVLAEFSTFGSGSTKTIFNDIINPSYKDFFEMRFSDETSSLISLMSNSFEYDQKLLDSKSSYDIFCVKNDVSKVFLELLKHKKVDYLIMDTYSDAVLNVLLLENGCYITDSFRLHNTSLYNSLSIKKRFNIRYNFNEYFKLWTDACDSFFKFMDTHCTDVKIILNCSRSVYKYYDNGEVGIDNNLKKACEVNKYRNILDKYILNNFDVDVLSFDNDTLIDKNHKFGYHQIHYFPDYYKTKIFQLKDIVESNNNLPNNLSVEFRNLRKIEALFNISKDEVDILNKENFDLRNRLYGFKKDNSILSDKLSKLEKDNDILSKNLDKFKRDNQLLENELNEIKNSSFYKIKNKLSK